MSVGELLPEQIFSENLHTVTGSLSAYSSTVKEPMVVLTVANLDIV